MLDDDTMTAGRVLMLSLQQQRSFVVSFLLEGVSALLNTERVCSNQIALLLSKHSKNSDYCSSGFPISA